MTNEAHIRSQLTVSKGNIDYQSRPGAFYGSVSGSKGPVPGAITVSTSGTSVDLSGLSTPGYCRIQNLDATNFVHVGAYDTVNSTFYPLLEILPGESYVFRLSRSIGTLRLQADTASVDVLVEAFEA